MGISSRSQKTDVSRIHAGFQVAARESIREASRGQTRQELVDNILQTFSSGKFTGPRAVSLEVVLAESSQRFLGKFRLGLYTVFSLPGVLLHGRKPDPPDLQAPYAKTVPAVFDVGYAWVTVQCYPKMTNCMEVFAAQARHRLGGISYLGAWVEPELEYNRRYYIVYIGTTPLGRIPASVVSNRQIRDLEVPTRVSAMLLPPGSTQTPVLDVKMPLEIGEGR